MTTKQKIVMKVLMQNEKCRTKAMKIVAVAEGVMSVALEGPENDRMVVVGVGIDSATLARSLNKRVGLTRFVSITEVKAEDGEKKKHDIHKCSSCSSSSSTASSTTWGYPVTYASTYSIDSYAPPYSGYDHLTGYSINTYAPPYSGNDHLAGLNSETPSICSIM